MRRRPTVDLKDHFDALRAADQRAIQIKEEGDRRALELAREIQSYKDEQANNLRSQIESERGNYATKTDLAALGDKIGLRLGPLETDHLLRQGKSQGFGMSTKLVVGMISAVGGVLSIIVLFANGKLG
jgi:hypothetical protein